MSRHGSPTATQGRRNLLSVILGYLETDTAERQYTRKLTPGVYNSENRNNGMSQNRDG